MTIGIGAAIFISVSAFLFTMIARRRKKKTPGQNPYIEALHMLLEGRKAEAMEKLKRIVRADTENIMAYIVLGDLFRDRGYPMKAAKIHRSLLVRSGLNETETTTILTRLVMDYKVNRSLELAIDTAEKLAQRNKKGIKCQKLLLGLYEEKGDWDKAFFYRQSLGKWQKQQRQDILALYKVQAGLAMAAKGQEREGRIRYREAIRIDRGCLPAYLHWGDSYRRENRQEDALQVYRDYVHKNPEWAHLAFDRMKELLYELGRYGEIEEIYREIIHKQPARPQVYLYMAELLVSQGKTDEAVKMVRTVLEKNPDSVEARHLLVRLLHERGETDEALRAALSLLNTSLKHETAYRCSECGFESQDPLWHCPQCLSWNTFLGDAS